MEKRSLFNVLDACGATEEQLLEYIELKTGSAKSPFDLIFVKNAQQIITRELKKGLGKLVGIVIQNIVFYTKSITIDDFEEKSNITIGDVDAVAKRLYPSATLLSEDPSLFLLQKNVKEIKKLVFQLEYLGYETPFTRKLLLPELFTWTDVYALGIMLATYSKRHLNISHALRNGYAFILTEQKN